MTKKEYKDRLNTSICQYIKNKFLTPPKINGIQVSANAYARAVGLTESTINKLDKGIGYNIPVTTIALITKFENSNLADLFSEVLKDN